MTDIELVIKIPEEIRLALINNIQLSSNQQSLCDSCINHAIINGTPLPKGHGKLGDLDKIKKEMQNYYDDCTKTSEYTRLGFETAIAIVEDTSTIIKSDRAESEG